MFCTKCGADIPDNAQFCIKCGTPLSTVPNVTGQEAQPGTNYDPGAAQSGTYYAPPGTPVYGVPQGEVIYQPQAPKKRKHLKAIIIAAAGVFVIAAGIVLTLVLTYNASAFRYNKAVEMINSDPAGAKTEFAALGDFEDSKDKSELCQDKIDYNAAKALMDAKNYAGAKTAFEALGSYEDSASMSVLCQNNIDYNKAAALLASGNNEEALKIYQSLGSFLDSEAQATECENLIGYDSAKELFSSGDFDGAKTAFTALGTYRDSEDMAKSCDYSKAEAFVASKKFYSAYLLFNSLGGYKDSSDRAASCIQKGSTKEVYRNPKYKSKTVPLTFKTPKDGYSTFIKVYKGTTLVSSVFISSGKSKKIKLPAGTYNFKVSNGTTWFGPEEMYGEMGNYYQVVFNSKGKTTWTLKRHWIYSLKVRTSKGGYPGYPVGTDGF